MSELEDKLKGLIDTVQEMNTILTKSREIGETTAMTILYKNIEDGIFNKIQNANEYQLKKIMSYNFRYYKEYNTDKEALSREIKKRIREDKLNKLNIC